MPVLTSEQSKAKDAKARIRDCFDEQITHIRAGDWRGTKGAEVSLVGNLRDLHGTVCTCCPKRVTA